MWNDYKNVLLDLSNSEEKNNYYQGWHGLFSKYYCVFILLFYKDMNSQMKTELMAQYSCNNWITCSFTKLDRFEAHFML
jgi:hypothetical protein